MILIIDCTRQDLPLLRDEFVTPIRNIVQKAGYQALTQPLRDAHPVEGIEGVILTGTALQDREYLTTGIPDWLAVWDGPVFAIGAGMLLLITSAGGSLIPSEKIGMAEISVTRGDPVFAGWERFTAWELHQEGVTIPPSFREIARSGSGTRAVRSADHPRYGVLFHPEVRNEWIIQNFLALSEREPVRSDHPGWSERVRPEGKPGFPG